MEKEYRITADQLETINHYKRMFDINSDRIQELCDSKKDDIVYGFELGMIYSHLRECFMGMNNFENEIRGQVIESEIIGQEIKDETKMESGDKYHFNEENII
jgi:uncharacterized Ntn-hydrolase superfamily protein